METRQSLSAAQSLRTLRTLVHADEFERFLAKHFPHSKVEPAVLRARITRSDAQAVNF